MIKNLPQIGMGTWLLEDKDELLKTIKAGLDIGYKHIDTAQIYDNETQIGEVLKEINANRDDIFLTSKIYALNFMNYATKSLEETLRRLQIKQLDLVLLHSPFNEESESKAYKEMMIARDNGLVRHIGVSNFSIQKLKAIHEATGEWPYVNQIVLSPTFRAEKLEAFCKEMGINLTGYSIMKSYFNPSPFFANSGLNEGQKATIDTIAKKYNKDAGQVLNRWAVQLGYSVIPKSSKVSRVISNFNIFDFELTLDEMEILNSFNIASSEKYAELIETWTSPITKEQEEKGLLFNRNFKPGK